MNEADIEIWCDETLPDLYEEGMFDNEDISDDVWAGVAAALEPLAEELSEGEKEAIHDAAADWFRAYRDLVIEAIEPVPPAAITALTSKPQTAQHTADWYAQRRNRLTASEFAHILDGRRGSLLRSKLATDTQDRPLSQPIGIAQADGEMNATIWGHRFEPVTRRIFELEISGPGTVCDTLGRFTHAKIPWLSASPDGLITKGSLAGRLVEIKSPKTRQPGTFVPLEYWIQMQIQMEVCDLDTVEFVEAQFAQRPLATFNDSPADQAACKEARWKGRLEVRGSLEDSSTWRYRYTAPVEDLEDAAFDDYDEAYQGTDLLESSVWWLTGFYPRTVSRSAAWWASTGWPNAELFWAEVESLRLTPDRVPTSPRARRGAIDEDVVEHIGWLGSLTE